MGSVGNQNPWAPYYNYRDCSQGICSIYCPQFCYFFFPPPPPSDDDSNTPFSPLIIAIIAVLASAFLLVSYYTIVTRYCRRRSNQNSSVEAEENHQTAHDQWQLVPSSGLDESLIKTITVCKYIKGDGLIEGTECAVCLSEFQENESLKLLPKCSHAFHLPCIDTWLKSHSNCPLCRANVIALAHPTTPPVVPSSQTSSSINISSYEVHRSDDLILIVDGQDRYCGDQTVLSLADDDDNDENPESPIQETGNAEGTEGSNQEGVKEFRRSISLDTFSSQRQILISDILKIEEVVEDLQVGIGSSKGIEVEESKSSGNSRLKRSISTGRFMLKVHDKGKNSIALPN